MQTKSEFIWYIVVILTVITITMWCIYEEPKPKNITERTIEIAEITTEENKKTIDIETDKGVDIQDVKLMSKYNSVAEMTEPIAETKDNVGDNGENDIETDIETEYKVEAKIETEIKDEIELPIKNEPVFYLSDYERMVVECMVMGESGGELYDGQILVAQCIINACLKDNIQPSEVRVKYGYSGWNNNPSDSVKEAVSAVFDDGYKITDEGILYFYAPKLCKSNWHESQRYVVEVGGHRFFAEW